MKENADVIEHKVSRGCRFPAELITKARPSYTRTPHFTIRLRNEMFKPDREIP